MARGTKVFSVFCLALFLFFPVVALADSVLIDDGQFLVASLSDIYLTPLFALSTSSATEPWEDFESGIHELLVPTENYQFYCDCSYFSKHATIYCEYFGTTVPYEPHTTTEEDWSAFVNLMENLSLSIGELAARTGLIDPDITIDCRDPAGSGPTTSLDDLKTGGSQKFLTIENNAITWDLRAKYIANPTPTPSPTEVPITTYRTGTLEVGAEIPAGEYVLMSVSDVGAYFAILDDDLEIIENDNFDYNSIVTVKKGEYLELSRCDAYPAEEFRKFRTLDASQTGCMLEVGVDLPAGKYKLVTADGESGYWCVYSTSRHDKIVDNDNFENTDFVKVKKGQYLVLNRCTISN